MQIIARNFQGFPAAVAAMVAIATCASLAVAALAGDFSRPAIAILMVITGGGFLLMGAVVSGGFPILGSMSGSDQGLNFTNTMHTEMLLQQSLQHEPARAERARRRRLGVRLLAAGSILVVVALAIG